MASTYKAALSLLRSVKIEQRGADSNSLFDLTLIKIEKESGIFWCDISS